MTPDGSPQAEFIAPKSRVMAQRVDHGGHRGIFPECAQPHRLQISAGEVASTAVPPPRGRAS